MPHSVVLLLVFLTFVVTESSAQTVTESFQEIETWYRNAIRKSQEEHQATRSLQAERLSRLTALVDQFSEVKLADDSVQDVLCLARSCELIGQQESAAALASEIVEEYPGNADAHALLIRYALQQETDHGRILELIQTAMEFPSAQRAISPYWGALAIRCSRKGEHQAACNAFEEYFESRIRLARPDAPAAIEPLPGILPLFQAECMAIRDDSRFRKAINRFNKMLDEMVEASIVEEVDSASEAEAVCATLVVWMEFAGYGNEELHLNFVSGLIEMLVANEEACSTSNRLPHLLDRISVSVLRSSHKLNVRQALSDIDGCNQKIQRIDGKSQRLREWLVTFKEQVRGVVVEESKFRRASSTEADFSNETDLGEDFIWTIHVTIGNDIRESPFDFKDNLMLLKAAGAERFRIGHSQPNDELIRSLLSSPAGSSFDFELQSVDSPDPSVDSSDNIESDSQWTIDTGAGKPTRVQGMSPQKIGWLGWLIVEARLANQK